MSKAPNGLKKPAQIGSINGGWSILFRLTLATYPLVIAWCGWITVQQFRDQAFRDIGPRYTKTQAELDNAAMRAEMIEIINALPPPDWRDRIVSIEALSRANADKLTRLLVLIEEKRE